MSQQMLFMLVWFNSDISELRAQLGERVLKELPYATPRISKESGIANWPFDASEYVEPFASGVIVDHSVTVADFRKRHSE